MFVMLVEYDGSEEFCINLDFDVRLDDVILNVEVEFIVLIFE